MSTNQDSNLSPQPISGRGSLGLLGTAAFLPVWHDFRRAWGELVVFEFLYKFLEAWLFVPAVAMVLSAVLSRSGHIAVSNRDVLDFILTPSGLLYAAFFITASVVLLLLEEAGIMALVSQRDSAERPPVKQMLRESFWKTLRVAQLGAIKVALLALTFVPFVLLAGLTYGIFLSRHDINYYLADRPPAFWVAAGVGFLLLLTALTIGMLLYVQWAFALPILLFENQFPRAALRASRERVRGVGWRVGLCLLGWLLVALLLGVALEAGFRLFSTAVLANAGERPIALILLLLVAQGGLLAILSFVAAAGLALVTRRLYLLRSEQLGLLRPEGSERAPGTEKQAAPWSRRLAYLSLAIVLLAPVVSWADLPRHLAAQPLVQVTAHRGHSRAAPENTLSAIRKAIASGADFAEVDVQQTADGVVVLLHDSDLKRVAGDPRRVGELSFDEVRKLDVGSWFDPVFAGERVPTLAEVVDLCRGRIKLNIELKIYGPDRQLALEVARLVHEHDFESDCLLTSFSYDALLEAKQHNPRVRTGLIIAYALGDVSRLEFDVLSVRADFLSDKVLREARRLGKEIHVWTVNDSRQMFRLMKRGVDNIITDDPDMLIRVREEWTSLTGTERLLLASRLLLGLES
jgi:glycerophosphoryl diester phosphodiesterase